jgi:hypothetical protein
VTQDVFNFAEGQEARDAGLDRAGSPFYRRELLESAKAHAIALGHAIGEVTADDVFRRMLNWGQEPELLGNAAGSIFRGSEWVCVGVKQSERKSRHAGKISVWRLKG